MKEESLHHLFSFNRRSMPPKGFVTVRVGLEEEEKERFVVPVEHFRHPLFMEMLEEAEKEFGFEQKGAIVIPCRVDRFNQVEAIIDREFAGAAGERHHHGSHHHVPHFAGCFRA
ncbi:SAUR-like auxin-responsive protein family [Rhynchospora pubera]|nr:SAUR-like auxin-responsive protein family [Rhynchospora pubera]KAJ4784182.1 SAUR-like auxin-responsive protein family [Rhynchospora pubera]